MGRISKFLRKSNTLLDSNPQLSKEWHPTKNGSLTPREVAPRSGKKVWWICSKGHEWQATGHSRDRGNGCPYCAGQAVCDDNCLQTVNPELAKEWHPTRNGNLTPRDVTPGSHKKVWWICNKGHEWQAIVRPRAKGVGCPYCAGKAACDDNCLEIINPDLAKEWHPTKNGDLTPRNVTPNSNRKVWWICGNDHPWLATINNRASGNGCPYCAGRLACDDNSLLTLNPKLAKEWHPTRNGGLTPGDVTPGSGKKVWWICRRDHVWQAVIASRASGAGCPYCNSRTSRIELRIYSEMKHLFKNVEHRKKVHGVECDIYIPELSLGIEVDGLYWHKNRRLPDEEKTTFLRNRGIALLRLRERGLQRISAHDVFFSASETDFEVVSRLARRILKVTNIQGELRCRVEQYLREGELVNNDEYVKLLEMLPSPLPGFSLAECSEVVAKEWHPTRNGNLTPRDVTSSSHLKVWWICSKGHEWQAVIAKRTVGRGCPYCAGRAVCDDNCLLTLNPTLAREWHPTKNGDLIPRDVTPGSKKKVWWICGKGHEWPAEIQSRISGNGCPYCAGRAACDDNSLLTLNPKLAKEWHRTRNGDLTPGDVTLGSCRKVWWICSKDHEWQAVIASRVSGRGCPYCAGRVACDDNCLQTIKPSLAKEWHSTKNRNLTPNEVTPGSNKKVWWICSKGHEWRAKIQDRTNGRGCPYCAGRAVCDDNCLQTINPGLAREWHPTRNGDLTPRDVIPGSKKKVWWICSKGHEWQAFIYSRASDRGCPYCVRRYMRTA